MCIMAAYIIVQANITDKEKYKEYLNKVTPIVEKYSGENLVRGGNMKKCLEIGIMKEQW